MATLSKAYLVANRKRGALYNEPQNRPSYIAARTQPIVPDVSAILGSIDARQLRRLAQ